MFINFPNLRWLLTHQDFKINDEKYFIKDTNAFRIHSITKEGRKLTLHITRTFSIFKYKNFLILRLENFTAAETLIIELCL